MSRVRVALTGFPGAPGVSTFYCLEPSAFLGPLHTLYQGLANQMPIDVTATIESVGDTIEATNGELAGSWAGTGGAPMAGGDANGYAAPVGFALEWLTGIVVDGHRLRGRTFVVPAASTIFQADGTIVESILDAKRTDLVTFVSAVANNFVVWHRPRKAAAATAFHPAVTERAGSFAFVNGSRIADKACVLRSRRD